jgi:hypothetical protein
VGSGVAGAFGGTAPVVVGVAGRVRLAPDAVATWPRGPVAGRAERAETEAVCGAPLPHAVRPTTATAAAANELERDRASIASNLAAGQAETSWAAVAQRA